MSRVMNAPPFDERTLPSMDTRQLRSAYDSPVPAQQPVKDRVRGIVEMARDQLNQLAMLNVSLRGHQPQPPMNGSEKVTHQPEHLDYFVDLARDLLQRCHEEIQELRRTLGD